MSLPLPDKRMGPGSVIKVTKKDGAVIMQWLGDLRRCGISDREFRYVRGKYSAIGIGESFGVKASIAARFIAKLEGTADFEKAGGAIMQIEASQHWSMSRPSRRQRASLSTDLAKVSLRRHGQAASRPTAEAISH